jgi:hypothetical protein
MPRRAVASSSPASHSAIEVMRATSPDGLFDGVLVRDEWGGAMGGFLWFVFVVPKGKAFPIDERQAVFYANRLSRSSIGWTKPHLLEINYDKAEIEQFRNPWTSWDVQQAGKPSQQGYYVEMRLVPFTSDYSLLTPDGSFRMD